MLDISIHYLSKLLGVAYRGRPTVFANGAAIDSRDVSKGDLFFALPGEKVDGHKFVQDALNKGAVGAVITDYKKVPNYEVKNLLIAKDVKKVLQDLAKLTRQNCTLPAVAITGSVGKTSTKDLLYSILKEKYKTLKSKGNHNNELGLPLTLCHLDKSYKALIVEMGMRGLGQIDFLCSIAAPTHAIITNIGETHKELLGSIENIAKAKAEILKHIPKDGTIMLNKKDEELLKPWLGESDANILWFGTDDSCDFWVNEIIDMDENKSIFTVGTCSEKEEIELSVPGEHNIMNALASIGIARSLDISWDLIKEGLKNVEMSSMRLEIETHPTKGYKVINDAYNANPQSMHAALGFLGQYEESRKIAVLGDMYELGEDEQEQHKLLGKKVIEENIDLLIAVGDLGKFIAIGASEAGMDSSRVKIMQTNKEATAFLKEYLQKDDVILVKGSRGMEMEKIVQDLMR